jgi:hypothetical protein
VDFRLSGRRDVAAAKAFFRKAMKSPGSSPATITLHGYAASHRAVRGMKAGSELIGDTKVRSSRYLNNFFEQDHRGVKSRLDPMLGLKRFGTAAITIAGIELFSVSKEVNSTSGSCATRTDVRPPSGRRCCQRNKMHASVGVVTVPTQIAPQPLELRSDQWCLEYCLTGLVLGASLHVLDRCEFQIYFRAT